MAQRPLVTDRYEQPQRLVAGRRGAVSAVLILDGVLSPLNVPVLDTANFVGYVLWSVWLVAFAVLLVRRPAPAPARAFSRSWSGSRTRY
jgi:hypothetical protein